MDNVYTFGQKVFVEANSDIDLIVVSDTALKYNGLVYGGMYGDVLTVRTPKESQDNMDLLSVCLEYNHFSDLEFCSNSIGYKNLWLPTPERSIVDVIAFMDIYFMEGPLVEALQSYLQSESFCNLPELYRVAEHYGVNKDKIDYWINEARTSHSMSMG